MGALYQRLYHPSNPQSLAKQGFKHHKKGAFLPLSIPKAPFLPKTLRNVENFRRFCSAEFSRSSHLKMPKRLTTPLFRAIIVNARKSGYAPVAQLDRVSDSDSEGHAFESHRAYQKTPRSRNGLRGLFFYMLFFFAPVLNPWEFKTGAFWRMNSENRLLTPSPAARRPSGCRSRPSKEPPRRCSSGLRRSCGGRPR